MPEAELRIEHPRPGPQRARRVPRPSRPLRRTRPCARVSAGVERAGAGDEGGDDVGGVPVEADRTRRYQAPRASAVPDPGRSPGRMSDGQDSWCRVPFVLGSLGMSVCLQRELVGARRYGVGGDRCGVSARSIVSISWRSDGTASAWVGARHRKGLVLSTRGIGGMVTTISAPSPNSLQGSARCSRRGRRSS